METNFRIFKDNAAEAELEGALGAGSDLVIVGSPSEYFEGRRFWKRRIRARTSLTLMYTRKTFRKRSAPELYFAHTSP